METRRAHGIVAMLLCAVSLSACRATIQELPPALASDTNNGGRTQSITVHPTERDTIIIATQFGGLWRTRDGGARWVHLDGLNHVFVNDVQFGVDGRTVVATVGRSLAEDHAGGIWLSKDGGDTWSRPAGSRLPSGPGVPPRSQAYGIAIDPDDRRIWYVGTDQGIAVSRDNGSNWQYPAGTPTWAAPGRLRDRVQSLVALEGGVVIAMTSTAVWRSDDRADTWRVVRNGDFSFYDWASQPLYANHGWNKMDRWPGRNAVVLVINATRLALYETDVFGSPMDPSTDRWTEVELPGGYYPNGRSTFVRISNHPSWSGYVRIWVGQLDRILRVPRKTLAGFRQLAPDDWKPMGTERGWHADFGDLGLDAQRRPTLLGSDGGVFKPVDGNEDAWTNAAPAGSGFNSLLISDLLGLNRVIEGRNVTALHFTTQDNAIWGSLDGDAWSGVDYAEGLLLQGPYGAGSAEPVTLSYVRIPGFSPYRLSGPGLAGQRDAPDEPGWQSDVPGGGKTTRASDMFYLKQNHWLRRFAPVSGGTQLLVSTDDGATWRARYSLRVVQLSRLRRTNIQYAAPDVRAWFAAAIPGTTRIGLVRLTDITKQQREPITASSIVRLPNGGSLGQRGTEFDWAGVFGVNPYNDLHLIAPDVVSGKVLGTVDGGRSWFVDEGLTTLVRDFGKLRLYDGHVYEMGVTEIAFDPYRPGRVLVGTREAGIVCSNDYGSTWGRIPGSRRALYVTGFHFRPDGAVNVATYGRGMWFVPMGRNACVGGRPTRESASGTTLVRTVADFMAGPLDGVPAVPRKGSSASWFESTSLPTPPGYGRSVEAPASEETGEPLVLATSSFPSSAGTLVVPGGSFEIVATGIDPSRPFVVAIGRDPVAHRPLPASGEWPLRAHVELPRHLAIGVHVVTVSQGGVTASTSIRIVRFDPEGDATPPASGPTRA